MLVAPAVVAAQAIERNLPSAPTPSAPDISVPNVVSSDQDPTPIGPPLRALVTLGPTDPMVVGASVNKLDLARTPGLGTDRARLSRFIGRPISKRLIAEVLAEITRRYRVRGRPFVSVSTPEQEITGGVLQVRVVEFHLGAKSAPGASPHDAAYIESRVRAEPGDPIDAEALSQDLDWLNRFPFRKTDAVFAPGTALGVTDLRLQTTVQKPWSVYAGYANSGSPLTGPDRYFLGGQTVLPWLHDAYASYQFTGSNNALFDAARLFDTAADPRYVSQAGRLIVPTLPRQTLEASISYVQSNQPAQDFLVRQTTYEATLDYRSALSNLWRPLPGEAAVGVEIKRQTSRTDFGGVDVMGAAFDVFQVTLAYAGQESDALGRANGEVVLRLSPGGIDDRNTGDAFSAFSKARSTQASYAYLSGTASRSTLLPSILGVRGLALSNSLIGQYAPQPLPLTEQIGLGNNNLVRGYTLDDGAFDTGLISRNELRGPSITLLGRTHWATDLVSPFVFVDAGYGKDQRTKADAAPVSAGLGADYQLSTRFAASIDGAWALRDVGLTKAGDVRLESRLTATF